MTASVSEPGATCAWSITNGQIQSGAGTASITFVPTGCGTTIQLSVTVTKNGCSATDDHVVTRTTATAALTGAATINQGEQTPLSLTLTGIGPWTITWSDTPSSPQTTSNSSVTRTVAPNATTMYSVTVTDAFGCAANVNGTPVVTVKPPAPGNVNASATSTTQVVVTWTYSGSADRFRIYRDSTYAGESTGLSFTDNGRTPSTAYLYAVRAVVANTESAPSADVAATFNFADFPLLGSSSVPPASATAIRAAHVTVLQNAVNAVRIRASLPAIAFPTIVAQVTTVQAPHVQALRSALDDARAALNLTRLFNGTTIAPGMPIRAIDLNAIRGGM